MDEEGNRENVPGENGSPGTVVSPDMEANPSSGDSPEPSKNDKPQPFQASEEQISQPAPSISVDGAHSWTGPEFVSHEKTFVWYAKVWAIAIIAAVLIYLIVHDIVTSIMMVIVALFFCVYSARKPHDISYRLDDKGIVIGAKHYSFEEFRYFTAASEGKYITITFIPLKRFSLPAGMCYEGPDAEKLINAISKSLPFEQHRLDIIDNFMQRIRF